jgi:hypothetical protein
MGFDLSAWELPKSTLMFIIRALCNQQLATWIQNGSSGNEYLFHSKYLNGLL